LFEILFVVRTLVRSFSRTKVLTTNPLMAIDLLRQDLSPVTDKN
jgi:hypothetical protein